jgi:hypothetical protein
LFIVGAPCLALLIAIVLTADLAPHLCGHCKDSPLAWGEVLLDHVVLSYVLDFCCQLGEGWARFECRYVDRSALLHLLPTLATISKSMYMCATLTLQYTALRLATHDLELGVVKVSTQRKAKMLLQAFDHNINTFSKSWRLDFKVPEKLRVTALSDL